MPPSKSQSQDSYIVNIDSAATAIALNTREIMDSWELLDSAAKSRILMELRNDLQDALKSVKALQALERLRSTL